MPESKFSDTPRAFADLAKGLYVLTASHEGKRAGVLVRSVQPCADEPPLIAVAVKTGHWIEPLIRDSHVFAICRVSTSDRLMLRKFAETSRPRDGDPFDCVRAEKLVTGAPIISKSPLVLDCEVVRHFDLEADHELFIGHVLACRIGPATPVAAFDADPPTIT
ncbi:MAG TPA: flavin reductase family protein [Phycisphaerales bacterium]|nr:flavin reductase family protein [Phycisphaerales bacterium]